jgi:hypothetical protein
MCSRLLLGVEIIFSDDTLQNERVRFTCDHFDHHCIFCQVPYLSYGAHCREFALTLYSGFVVKYIAVRHLARDGMQNKKRKDGGWGSELRSNLQAL